MTEAEQDSFMVAVNKITGLWDTEKLSALFKELSEEDLSYTGYDDFEIQALLNDSLNNIEFVDDDGEDSSFYDEPQKSYIRCPQCGHIDTTTHFVKVNPKEESNE